MPGACQVAPGWQPEVAAEHGDEGAGAAEAQRMGDIGHAAAVGQLAQGLGQAGLLPPLGEAEGGLVAEVAGQAARGKPGPVRPFGQDR
ncbi:hypothetical protein G6F35_018724 [Rhizopus arrhizus]|nr:hypothetical protein G6F35_018724 [Rhizopus arrhizus]